MAVIASDTNQKANDSGSEVTPSEPFLLCCFRRHNLPDSVVVLGCSCSQTPWHVMLGGLSISTSV